MESDQNLCPYMEMFSALTEFGAGEYFTSGQDIDQLSPEGQVWCSVPWDKGVGLLTTVHSN